MDALSIDVAAELMSLQLYLQEIQASRGHREAQAYFKSQDIELRNVYKWNPVTQRIEPRNTIEPALP